MAEQTKTAEQIASEHINGLLEDRAFFANQVQQICEALGLQPACHFADIFKEVQSLVEDKKRIEEAESKLSKIFRWIEHHHQDGFVDSQSYTEQLDKIMDGMYARVDAAEAMTTKPILPVPVLDESTPYGVREAIESMKKPSSETLTDSIGGQITFTVIESGAQVTCKYLEQICETCKMRLATDGKKLWCSNGKCENEGDQEV